MLALLLALPLLATAFRNPLSIGADPFVAQPSGNPNSYVLFTRGTDIAIYVVQSLDELAAAEPHRVWCNNLQVKAELWAPELHFVDGHWHIYASGKKSRAATEYRLFALASLNASNPLGPYEWSGWLAPELNAIDASYFTWASSGYFLWSPFDPHPTQGWQQGVWLGPAIDGSHIGHPRIQLSCADHAWEQAQPGHPINEGPIALQRNGRLWITFSASLAMTPDYCLGLLELRQGGNVLDKSSWVKHPEPVLRRAAELGIYGPGHNGFACGADGSWVLIYHVKTSTHITFSDRVLHAHKFGWDSDGRPDFCMPAPILLRPAGPQPSRHQYLPRTS